MGIEKRSVDFAKETDDVMVLLAQLVRDIRAGKSPGDIASTNVGNLVTALAGVDQVQGEVELHRKVALETIGYRLGDLTDAILGEQKPAAEATPVPL